MPKQNRVAPDGSLHAVAARGTFMGNRGRLHDTQTRTLGKRQWRLKAWLICRTAFNQRQRVVMGDSYTELFFLDEVTALAAGHRPCFECRRAAFRAYQTAWQKGRGHDCAPPAGLMDQILHAERLQGVAKRRHRINPATLPDGAMIELNGLVYALKAGALLAWHFEGYQASSLTLAELPAFVACLTPPASLLVLQHGYDAVWHESA